MSPITTVDESAADAPSVDLGGFIDETSLAAEVTTRNPNRAQKHPFRLYHTRVRKSAGVPDSTEARKMSSQICSEVARLPFVPDSEENIADPGAPETTEFEQQIVKLAKRAEEALDSVMVWTSAARKIARAALELRKADPDGSLGKRSGGKEGAWVNDPLPGAEQADD